MQGSNYIFALQDANFNFWKVKDDGSVTISSEPYFLDYAPDGWDELSIQIIRNKKYFGIDRTVTVPLSYVKDGAKIMKKILYQNGLFEPLYLVIASQRLDYTAGVGYGYWYKQIYRGKVDFSTFNHSGAKVTCSTLEEGLAKYLKSNEGTEYEFDMNVDAAVNVKMDGVVLRQKSTFVVVNGYENFNGQHIPNMILAQSESYQSFNAKTVDRMYFANNSNLFNSDNYFLSTENTTENTQITIDYNFGVTVSSALGVTPHCGSTLMVREFDLTGTATNAFPIVSYGDGASLYQHHQLSGSVTFTGVPDRRYFMIMVYTISGTIATGSSADGATTWMYDNGENDIIKVSYTYRFKHTFIKAFRGQYLFEKLIEKVTEGTYTAALSSMLHGVFKDVVFVCGNSIRGLESPVMKISFKNFFDFFDCIDSVGIVETQNKAILFERKPDLVDSANYIDLPSPNNGSIKIGVIKESLFNELQIGYPELKNEVGILNGNDEFNTKYIFSIGATDSPSVLNKISPIKASCYEIEGIRVITLQKDTTDNKEDNEIYALHISSTATAGVGDEPAQYYELNRILNVGATGLIEAESVFNLFLSPKRNIIRNGSEIHSRFYKADSKILAYKSSDRNSAVVSDGITEKSDISIGALDAPYGLPISIDADFPTPDDTLQLLDNNPLQVFRFPIDGKYYKGILIKGSIADSTKRTQQYSFQFLPQNDLTKLLEYEG